MYSDEEMKARQAALANVRAGMSTADAWMALQPKHVSRYDFAPRTTGSGKVMAARFSGRCVDCGGYIDAGETIRYDGKAHHYPECPKEEGAGDFDYDSRWSEGRDAYDECASEREAERRNEMALGGYDRMPSREEQDEEERDRYFDWLQSERCAVSLEVPAPATLPDGKMTLEFEDGHHRTFLIRTQKTGSLAGKRIVKYLAGSDNADEKSYVGFAFLLANGSLAVWSRFRGETSLTRDASALADPAKAAELGLRYALASGCCYRCGRELTVPASIHRGLGPDCAKAVNA